MTDTPTLWRDMTPEEKGALLLAHHEGKVIEFFGAITQEWIMAGPSWNPSVAYRIRPTPTRVTVDLFAGTTAETIACIGTIEYVDGKPDPASIKIEEITQ